MAADLRALLYYDDLPGLMDWILTHYDQLGTTVLDHDGWFGEMTPFDYAIFVGAVRCVTWFLQTGVSPNAVHPQLDPLHYVDQSSEAMVTVLLKYGANPNVRARTNAPVSLLYHKAVWSYGTADRAIARRLFWAGARLTDEDKRMPVTARSERVMVDLILEAEAIMNRRVTQCRLACMIILRCMPGPRDCTRDWVRRMVWPRRHGQEWLPGVELPGFLKEVD